MAQPATSEATTRQAALRRIADLPGPSGLPLLGNALQIDSSRFHQILESWHRQYGDFFRFRLAEREFLVVADPEAIGAVLRDRPDGFNRTDRATEVIADMGFDGVFSARGERWRRQRPMVMAGFDPAHIRSYFPTLAKVTERLARRWSRVAASGEPIDLLADLMRYTVDVTAGLAFGTDINTLESDREVIQNHLDKIFPAFFRRVLAPIPYWRYLKLPRDREVDRHLDALHHAVDEFIHQARRRLDADPSLRQKPRNLIEAMILARDAGDSGLDDDDVAANVLTMLLAGEDTTANTLAWMIYLLDQNRAACGALAGTVRAALGTDSHPTSYEQLAMLDSIEACTHETLRLKPVAPVMPLQAARDSVVADIAVPTGALVICLMRPAGTDSRRFPDAASFRPERWQADAPGQFGSARRVVMPFGGGPRICPGRYLALQEIKMVIAMLFGSFDLLDVRTRDGSAVRERLALTMAPCGLQLRLAVRGATRGAPA